MLAAIEAANGRNPEQLSADAGYCSEDTLDKLAERAIDGYVATKPAAMGSGEGSRSGKQSELDGTDPAELPSCGP